MDIVIFDIENNIGHWHGIYREGWCFRIQNLQASIHSSGHTLFFFLMQPTTMGVLMPQGNATKQ